MRNGCVLLQFLNEGAGALNGENDDEDAALDAPFAELCKEAQRMLARCAN